MKYNNILECTIMRQINEKQNRMDVIWKRKRREIRENKPENLLTIRISSKSCQQKHGHPTIHYAFRTQLFGSFRISNPNMAGQVRGEQFSGPVLLQMDLSGILTVVFPEVLLMVLWGMLPVILPVLHSFSLAGEVSCLISHTRLLTRKLYYSTMSLHLQQSFFFLTHTYHQI